MGRKKVNRYFAPKESKQEERVSQMLKMLDLSGAGDFLIRSLDVNKKKHGTPCDLLETLLAIEVTKREEERVKRWRKQADFPKVKTFELFDFGYQPTIDQRVINELRTCRFIDEGKNIVFLGPNGVGKTHLSIALGDKAINEGYETKFFTLRKLITKVNKIGHDPVKQQRLLRSLMLSKLIILDDIDFYRPEEQTKEFLFKLLSDRDEQNLSTILNSNKPFSKWEEIFPDKERAAALLDRILADEKRIIININGPSYRVKSNLKKYLQIAPASN